MKTRSLFSDLDGRLACEEHLGAEALALLERKPKARTLRTTLTVWTRWGVAEIAAAQRHRWVPKCERCGAEPILAE